MSDVKIQDVNLIATPEDTNKLPVSDGSGYAKTISVAQINGVHEAAYDHSTYLTETSADALYAPVLGTDDNYVTDTEKTKLSNLSGTNTGDQDLSGYSPTSHNHNLNDLTEKSYNSLTDKPTIPSVSGLLDETAHDVLDHTGLTGIPTAYTLPTASTTVLGGVKIDGTTILISDGVISSTGGSSGGVTDHGLLTGLSDDDHSQYLNETRHDALDHTGLTGVPTQYTDEMAQDAIGTLITNGTQTGITVAYDDANNKIDFTVVASGSGDVTGPSSATDGNIVLFDGITGKVIKNSTYNPASFASALGTDDNYVTDAEKTKLSNLSGVNTGDQDLSGYSQTSHNHSLNNLAEKSYNSLTDKPSIPSITGLLDETTHDALDHTGLTGIPAAYSLPTASTTVLGGVKVDGTTVTITDGVISSSATGGTEIPYQDEAPTSPSDGDLWVDKDATPSSTSASLLEAETVVSGSAVASVAFSELDGNAHGGYVFEVVWKNVYNGSNPLYMYVNGNETKTNYSAQYVLATHNSNTVSASLSDIQYIHDGTDYNSEHVMSLFVSKSVSGYTVATGHLATHLGASTDIKTLNIAWINETVITNITSISFNVANTGIGIGSTFRLYRRK